MSTNEGMPATDNAGISVQEHSAAVAAARQEERARIRAIVSGEEAKGRGAQALILATETALSVNEAEKLLAASPKETAVDALASRAMSGPEIGASTEPREPDARERASRGWQHAIAAANRSIGVKR